MLRNFLLLAIYIGIHNTLQGQSAQQFTAEVNALTTRDHTIDTRNLILFTGSSSIRLWPDLKKYFPEYNVLNRGFGGSQMSDLLYFYAKLIRPYNPTLIIIYEGDNDIHAGKTPAAILQTADSLLLAIRSDYPNVPVAFITPKPSPARWQLKNVYQDFNRQLIEWSRRRHLVYVLDVWHTMLDKHGNLKRDLYLDDGLHMNDNGYALWASVMSKNIPEILKRGANTKQK
jgi:lysophospholipase L1-like esterase